MKIIILGAGQVGVTLAESLARESFDITVVDNKRSTLAALSNRLDIQTVEGWASHPETLRQAGADDADLLVAVTSSDEVNMIACQISFSLFKIPLKIARIRTPAYISKDTLFNKEN
ncbi:MAG: NAD-binding protein, partial [Pseudomonadota bacterium]|nr:NAD-binding protein [Pseudomonadota bacterium]